MITIPKECPICGNPLEIRQEHNTKVLVCTNFDCPAQVQGKFEQIFGKNGLDVEGLSTQTISDLIEWGWLKDLRDVFNLTSHKEEWKQKKGYGDNVDKILSNIPTKIELWRVFILACIPNVGKQVAKTLAKQYKTWDNFRNTSFENLIQIDGIGEKMARTLINFDYSIIDETIKCYLTMIEKNDTNNKLENLVFCITGKLSRKRDDLVSIIEANGGSFGSVSKKTNYLICNDKTSNSGKSKKAKELGVPIITEDEFLSMI